jgi:hypothetical protein
MSGTVSFHADGADRWEPATLNYPVNSGDALWTEPAASAEIQFDASHIVTTERTELDVDTLNDRTVTLTVPQGEAFLRLPEVAADDSVTIRTPRGIVTIEQPGRYDIVAGDTEHPTLVTVIDGAARVVSDTMSPLEVAPGQTATLTGTDTFSGTVGPEIEDPFLRAQIAVRPPQPMAASAPAAPYLNYMTGADALETTGEWDSTPDYGPVWYPPVEPNWVPYQDGSWAWVGAWGWTWVAAETWGFAPFHYGRWAQVGPRWGWIPNYDRDHDHGHWGRPVYAPALVRWVDVGPRRPGGERNVGWIPLGPRERYEPWYRASPAYVREVNRTNVANVGNVENFVNRRGLTVATATDVAASRGIHPHTERDAAGMLASARPLSVGIHPTAATLGVTPVVARHVHVEAAAPGAAVRPAAPGPVLQAHFGRPGETGHVALRPPGGGPMQPFERVTGQPNEPGVGPEHAGQGSGAAAAAGAVGGAAIVGGAVLLNRAHQNEQGRTALPALTTPHGPAPNNAPPPGAVPGPRIATEPGTHGPNETPAHVGPVPGTPPHPAEVTHQPEALPGVHGPNEPPVHVGPVPGTPPHPAEATHQPEALPGAHGPNESPSRVGPVPGSPSHPAEVTHLPAASPGAHGPSEPLWQVGPAHGAPPHPAEAIHTPTPPTNVAPPQAHFQPPAQPHVQPPPPPQQHFQPPPQPQVHFQPPPQPHVQPPPPQVHAQMAPPPAAPHPAAPPPAQHHDCKPGQHC